MMAREGAREAVLAGLGVAIGGERLR